MTSVPMEPARDPNDEGSSAPQPAPKHGRNLPLAIGTGLLLAGLVFATLFTSLTAWTILVTAAIVISLAELYRVLERARGLKPAAILGYSAAIVLLFGTAWRGIGTTSFVFVATALTAFLWYLVDPERQRVTENLAATLFSVIYVPLFAAHVIAMARLEHGPSLTIAFIGATVLYDIGAYASGSFFGRHKIAPAISPSKTWEGAGGATLFVFLVALTAGPLFPGLELGTAAGLAAIVVVFAPLGDLAESLLKRDLGVKDMGGLLPGHGGMLDRIDALLFAAPFAYWFLAATR